MSSTERIKTTSKRMTIFEKARVLGLRASQLSNNAPAYVDTEGMTDCLQIAQKELEEKKIPFIIRRTLPDGSIEDWPISELEVIDKNF